MIKNLNKKSVAFAISCVSVFGISALNIPSIANAQANNAKGKADAAKTAVKTAVNDVVKSNAKFIPANPENLMVIDTTKGQIIVLLAPDFAPKHVTQIKTLVRSGFYDGIVFHRVIEGFMAQTGDPTGTGSGDSTLPDIPGEFVFTRTLQTPFTEATTVNGRSYGFVGIMPITTQPIVLMRMTKDGTVQGFGNHCKGAASMARTDNPNSANSQFFLMRDITPSLDAKYTVWGKVVAGQDVVDALKVGEPVINPDKMTKVQIASDIPAAKRPKVFIEDTASQEFKDKLAAKVASSGDAFNICSITPESEVR